MMMFKRPLDGALYLRRRGLKVFPLRPDSKVPIVSNWKQWAATSDEQEILNFGTANPTCNWAVSAEGLTIIDVDMKEGQNGIAELSKLEAVNGALPSTLVAVTPSEGLHYYFAGESKNTVGAIARGIDTRSSGGYVVAPGSRIGEKEYYIQDEADDFPQVPSWVSQAATQRRESITLNDNELVEQGSRNNVLTSLAGTMRARGMSQESILAALLAVNNTQLGLPLSESEVELIAESIARYKPDEAKAAAAFANNPEGFTSKLASLIDVAKLPKRQWIMEGRYISGFISVIVAKGGAGKSTLSMLDAVAIALNRPLTGYKIVKSGGVWIYNTEDPLEELERRLAALVINAKIPMSELNNVHLSSGRERPFIFATANRDSVVVDENAIDNAVNFIKENNIVLLIADPFVRTHNCNENDNMQIDKVVWCFQKIAERTGAAIGLVHHTSKAGGANSDGNMDAARGASALVNAARIAHTMANMGEKEAGLFGITEEERQWFVRLDSAKANLSAPTRLAKWFKKVSVVLPNGDDVGALSLSDVVNVREEQSKEREKHECEELATVFQMLFKNERRKALNKALAVQLLDPEKAYTDMFFGLNEKAVIEKVQAMVRSGKVKTDNIVYKLFEATNGPYRFYIGYEYIGVFEVTEDIEELLS